MKTILLAALCGLCVPAGQEGPPGGKKPNVLLICVDDLKPAIGCFGDVFARTPNIDRLARRGVRFDRAYCNQAVCSPSRNSLMTGLRPQTLGIYDLGTNFRKARPDAVTMAQQFQKHGWRTEAMGKIFHVGHGNHEDAASWSVPHFQAKTVAYALKENLGPTREGALFDNQKPQGVPRGAPTESADVPDETYGDGRIAVEAVRRLREAKLHPDRPFFMAVGFLKPHLPFVAPKKYWDLHDPGKLPQPGRLAPPEDAPSFAPQFGGELRQYRDVPEKGPMGEPLTRRLIHGYYAATSYMDAQLGKVLDALEETDLRKNTIVVLWGDHGWHLGDHGMWCKHTNYEEAARIPLILAVPGGKQDAATRAFVETVDLYPTLSELGGIPAPDGLDGRSFAKVLADPQAAHRESVIHVYPRGPRLGRALRTERYRLVEWKAPGGAPESAALELYDYQADPGETKNLAAEQPEVVARLRAALAAHPEALRPWKPGPEKPK